MAIGFLGRKLFALAATLPALAGGTMAAASYLGGYSDRQAMAYDQPPRRARRDLVAVYFSGNGAADRSTVAALQADGLPVLTVDAPALFRLGHDRAYIDALVADAMRQALARSHAGRIALIGTAFGAGVLDTGLGAVPADLRARIASVVLVRPASAVYFAAYPGDLFHPGAPDSDPRRTVRLLHGLPVTCIFETDGADSLCRTPQLAGASRVALPAGATLAQASVRAALVPPQAMH